MHVRNLGKVEKTGHDEQKHREIDEISGVGCLHVFAQCDETITLKKLGNIEFIYLSENVFVIA